MKEYIEREAVLQAMGEEPCVWNDTDEERQMRNDWRYYTDLVKEATAADVVERVRGEWIPQIYSYGTAECSVCGWSIPYCEECYGLTTRNFCPNCGADMRKDEA